MKRAFARATRMRHPPLRCLEESFCILSEKPKPVKIRRTFASLSMSVCRCVVYVCYVRGVKGEKKKTMIKLLQFHVISSIANCLL